MTRDYGRVVPKNVPDLIISTRTRSMPLFLSRHFISSSFLFIRFRLFSFRPAEDPAHTNIRRHRFTSRLVSSHSYFHLYPCNCAWRCSVLSSFFSSPTIIPDCQLPLFVYCCLLHVYTTICTALENWIIAGGYYCHPRSTLWSALSVWN